MSNILLHRFVECVEHSTVSDFAASTAEKYGASTDKESFDIQLPIGVMSTANSVARSCEGIVVPANPSKNNKAGVCVRVAV